MGCGSEAWRSAPFALPTQGKLKSLQSEDSGYSSHEVARLSKLICVLKERTGRNGTDRLQPLNDGRAHYLEFIKKSHRKSCSPHSRC
jgi:hypothetical protein